MGGTQTITTTKENIMATVKMSELKAGDRLVADGEPVEIARAYHPFNLSNMIAAELTDGRVVQAPAWMITYTLDNHDNIR